MSISRYFTLLLLIVAISTGCNKWLDVQPKTEMPRDIMFSTQTGFQDALSGVYINLISDSLYGRDLSFKFIEHLTSSWDVTSNSVEQKINRFNYQDANVELILKNIFGTQYNTIANINAILEQIDAKKEVFTTKGMYEMIKGECLALRAFCHFDLLRMWGPVPSDIKDGNVLPYVKSLSRVKNPHISYEAFKTEVLADLTTAETLLKEVDPITKYSLGQLQNPDNESNEFKPENPYISFRQFRINYYAIKALQARVHLWFGNKQQAYEAAKFVIDAKDKDGTAKFRLGADADLVKKDYVMSWEHIWSLYDFKLFQQYTDFFGNGNLKKGSSDAKVRTELYGNTGTDIRETKMWGLLTLSGGTKCYTIRKYLGSEKPAYIDEDLKRLPMLRASEMYLIVAEAGPAGEADAAWATFRTSRG
ncbi:MAG: RagB/SusD family nutrient uptake outer membrane protein, partial [Chitinophagaceae bacterium]|nr:RagB/SusD family nutrient uptake outer membrane protein [Chitinophagaceae bacterium]